MGVNFVVIVENSRHVSIREFKEGLLKDPVIGPYAWNEFLDDSPHKWPPWEAFEWENKRYFTWCLPPRLSNFNLYAFDPKHNEPDTCMITFLKIMLLVEQVAVGRELKPSCVPWVALCEITCILTSEIILCRSRGCAKFSCSDGADGKYPKALGMSGSLAH